MTQPSEKSNPQAIISAIDDHPWHWALSLSGIEAATFRSLLDELKTTIPTHKRKFDAESKRWLFHDCAQVIDILAAYRIPYECDAPPPTNRRIMSRSEALRTLHLAPTAPAWLIPIVYKGLARHCHPDAGGDLRTMQAVNQAMEALKQ